MGYFLTLITIKQATRFVKRLGAGIAGRTLGRGAFGMMEWYWK
jgi:hypothetical protein